MIRECRDCHEWKHDADFQPAHRRNYKRNQCRACRNKVALARYHRTKPPAKPKRPADITRLGVHNIRKPLVQNAVLDRARAMGSSFTMRDIADALGLPKETVNTVLTRALKKGQVIRHEIPAERPVGKQTVFLYRLVEGA